MSTNSFWQDVKSQIPILKSAQYEPKGKKQENPGRKWNEKLKKRSSSALSIFQVTHKVPSHIVSPKFSKETDPQFQNWKESRQYNSNVELSKCLDSVDEVISQSSKARPSQKSYHGSAQDLTMAWWQKKAPVNNSASKNPLCDLKEKSASISNIFNEKESNDNNLFFQQNGPPASLPGAHAFESVYNSYQDIPKNVNFSYQPTLPSNKGMRKQFLSEQNLSDACSPEEMYGLHSLDHNYPYKGTYNKLNFDISTIKELPEDRSDSPARLNDDNLSDVITDCGQNTCMSLPPSYTDTYRSLQNLCMDVPGTKRHPNLTTVSNVESHVTSDNTYHAFKSPDVDGSCFRSVQDLRDSSFLDENSLFSMDYKFTTNNLQSGSSKLLNGSAKQGVAEKNCFDNWLDNDRSVSMLDISEIGTHRRNFSRRNSSKIPKRRHTLSAHNLDGLSLNIGSCVEPSSRSNTMPPPDLKGNGKATASPETGVRLKNPNSPGMAAKSSCCKKAQAPERKSGCVGCQRKRHQVSRQNSMPLLKNGAARDKPGEGRKPLNRSCSNPGPRVRKPQVQEKQQAKMDQMKETPSSYTNEVNMNRSVVERLREEVHSHKRTIRQLSLRLPCERYMDNQPLSLGHMPSTSVDNVFDALVRPGRLRHDTLETELQELVNELRAENKNLRSELQETRDQADLLEFRVLELTEGSDRFSEAEKATFSRDSDEKTDPLQSVNVEDLSLPLSIDSGLDLTADGKRARCGQVETPQVKSLEAPSNTRLPTSLSDCSENSEKNEPFSSSKKQMTSPQTNEKGKLDEKGQRECGQADAVELSEIISNLQHFIDRPDQLQASLLAAVEKLRSLNSSVNDFEAKMSSMTRENQYLTETLSTLNEAQETRTEASGTESEIVSRKTPSLQSDLSDSESDTSASETTLAKKRFETLSNFQESGIFEGSSDVHHTATQTEDNGEAEQGRDQLLVDNARLNEALEELRRNYDQLLQNGDKCPRCLEWDEVDRGESRALKEQLRVSQGARKALYEEKCELEEAENDARLMVQRLDSQLTAAREMELLLSASLSQEQEISRELHKKVKELQYLQAAEKERNFRQNLLEKENLDDGVVSLVLSKDTYASQLEFVKHSLILLQVFRHFYLLNSWLSTADGSQAPTDGLEAVDEYVARSKASEVQETDKFEERQNDSHHLIELNSDDIDSSQSALKYPVDSELNFSASFLSLDEMIDQHPKFTEFLMPGFVDIGVQTEQTNENVDISNTEEILHLHQPANVQCHVQRVDVQTKSTMTVEKDLLSLRESFYLEQIETLQEEKSVLRKEFGQERAQAEEREGLLQDAVQELQAQLGDSERARAALQCEMELQKDKEETLSKDFQKYMEQSRNDQARSSELHEMEKVALRRDFDARLAEVAEDNRRHLERCTELERQLTALWRELEVVGMEALAEYEGGSPQSTSLCQGENDPASRTVDVLSQSCRSNILDTVRQLVKSENSLRAKISELEKKESAYRETIQEADQIMLSHVTSYKQRIDELEAANEQSEAKVRQLECSEDRLRSSLKNNARCDQDARVAELLEQLLSIEKSELELKHKLWNLERNEKQLKIKVIEGEKAQESLRAELRDQDDLVRKMHQLQSENTAITQQLQRAHESVRRAVDKQQTESLLKGRVEELEYSENALKNTLQQTCAAFAVKERRLNQQATALEEEVASLKKRLENASAKETQILESEHSLKRHVEALRAELKDAKRELKAFSADESSTRTEVSRLRSQLKQANGELTEAESINCSLRERLAASEQLRETLEHSLEERKRRHESDLLQLNLQVSQRESRLEETEGQLCELTQLHAAQELDLLASSPLEPVMRATRRLTSQLSLCDTCSRLQGTVIDDLTAQLDTLTDLLSGTSPQDDTDGEEYMDQASKSSEEMTGIHARTQAAEVGQDESVPCSPLEEDCASTNSQAVSSNPDEAKSGKCEGAQRATSPAPVPAPRRKRKLKRDFASSLRSSLKNRKKGGSTILEELEEKVRELEESVSRKDEELKLADSEATDLSTKLAAAQELVVSKEAETTLIRQAMIELQQQLTLNLENSETTKRNFESMSKVVQEERDRMQEKVDRLTLQLKELKDRGRVKDCIISTLINNIRAFLKSYHIKAIMAQLGRLREDFEIQKPRSEGNEEARPLNLSTANEILCNDSDHDVQNVFELLSQPLEMDKRPLFSSTLEEGLLQCTAEVAVQTNENLRAPSTVHKEVQAVHTSSSLADAPFVSTSVNSPVPQLHHTTGERIPSKLSLEKCAQETPVSHSVDNDVILSQNNTISTNNLTKTFVHQSTQTTPYLQKIGPHPKSFIPKIVRRSNSLVSSEGHRTKLPKSCHKSLGLVHGVDAVPSRSRTKACQLNLVSTDTPASLETIYKHPTETRAKPQRAISNVPNPGEAHSSPIRPTDNSNSLSEEKSCTMPTSPISLQSHDGSYHSTNKISRGKVLQRERHRNVQVTISSGTARWGKRSSEIVPSGNGETLQETLKEQVHKRNSRVEVVQRERQRNTTGIAKNFSAAQYSNCEADNGTVIPRPGDLKVTRWVGKDGVVIAWELQNHDGVAGFQVIVAGKVIQSVRSPKRTKALITGLPPGPSVSIGLVSVSTDGRCSKPAVVTCDRFSTSLKRELPCSSRRLK